MNPSSNHSSIFPHFAFHIKLSYHLEEEFRSQLVGLAVLGSPAMVFEMTILSQLLHPHWLRIWQNSTFSWI